MKDYAEPPTDRELLNQMYLETLDSLGIPEGRWKDMIEKESTKRKWDLIVNSKQRMISGNVLAQSCVNFLKEVIVMISIENRKISKSMKLESYEQ